MGIDQKIKIQKRAVFFDQDGTVIKHVDLLIDVKDIKILPGVVTAIRRLRQLGFLVIVITNQPVVARGLISENGVKVLEKRISWLLSQKGALVDDFFFCPHHPEATLKKYRVKCQCRKPAPGMILKAAKRYNIDLKNSFMVGDALIDSVAGHRAGVKTILVKTGPGHSKLDKIYKEEKPDKVVKKIYEAVKLICEK